MKPTEPVTEEETTLESIEVEDAEGLVISGSGDEESDVSEVASTREDTSTMMSYQDYTQHEQEEEERVTTEKDVTEKPSVAVEEVTKESSEDVEEVTKVSKSKSESYEETRIWYDGINEAGEFVDKAEESEDWRYRDVDGERIVQVYPVYIPARTYSDNDLLTNTIDQHTPSRKEVRTRTITCEEVDCLAWPSNKCCSPHVTKKRHSLEEINDKITATIVRIVKSVRWV